MPIRGRCFPANSAGSGLCATPETSAGLVSRYHKLMNAHALPKLLLAFGGIVTVVGLAQNTQPQAATSQSLPKLAPGALGGITLIEGGGRGRGGFPMPAMPAVYDTLQQKIRVSIVTRGLDRPWSFIVLPDGDMLVSFRYTHELKAIHKGVLDPKPLTGLPRNAHAVRRRPPPEIRRKQTRLLRLRPGQPRIPGDDRRSVMVIAKGRYEGNKLTNVQDVFVTDPVFAGGSRMAFAPDGTLYMTISGALGRTSGWDPRKTRYRFRQSHSHPRRRTPSHRTTPSSANPAHVRRSSP